MVHATTPRGKAQQLQSLDRMYFKACARGASAPLIFAMKNLRGWKDEQTITVAALRGPLQEIMLLSDADLERLADGRPKSDDDDEPVEH